MIFIQIIYFNRKRRVTMSLVVVGFVEDLAGRGRDRERLEHELEKPNQIKKLKLHKIIN